MTKTAYKIAATTAIKTNTPQLAGRFVHNSSAFTLDGASAKSQPSHSSSERCQGERTASGRISIVDKIKNLTVPSTAAAGTATGPACPWHRTHGRRHGRQPACSHWAAAGRRRD